MSGWGATDSDESKPKWVTADQKEDVIANASGWVVKAGSTMTGYGNTSATPEVLVALGSLATSLGQATIDAVDWQSTGFDVSDGGDIIVNVHYSKPLPYHGDVTSTESITGSGVDNSGSGLAVQAAFIYSYDRVQIGYFTARAEGAENVCQGQILEISGGGTNFFCNRVEISNFSSADEGIQFRNGTTGYSMFSSVRIHNSGTDHGIDIDSGTDVIIASYAIEKTGSLANAGT